ncbi:uncharacterized protein PV07_07065 [Cladophialophora immunda]|uniref:Peptidase S12 Pab87-related C-terminal domain-containing protein n=1 Tax=Cladophialophora immunda TaxID=569365 RepID=A0A0D2CUJ0_9EURO|nr:uncharacterized protein PV07_07065 [Cladophialophora immunda]KIW27314.1 hypothetical protein PV07_07065 [Cladophialophora immunda]
MEATRQQLQAEQDKTTPVKPLEQYVGKYFNNIGNFYLDVTVNGDGLKMCVQGFDNTCHDLEHFCNDTFAWECNREKEARNVMSPS